MRKKIASLILLVAAFCTGFAKEITSPSGNIVVNVDVDGAGQPYYTASFKNNPFIKKSFLGFTLKETGALFGDFAITDMQETAVDDNWNPVWGEVKTIRNNYHQLKATLTQKTSGIILNIYFRVFDDGFGFRYEFPKQEKLNHFVIVKERTQFAMNGDHDAFWIPGDYDTNEYSYYHTKLSGVDATGGGKAQEIHAKTFFDKNATQTPLIMKSSTGLYISIHEAALSNYACMDLVVDKENLILNASLVPNAVGDACYLQTPAVTPWRTVVVSDKATDILASKIILNLNEPSKVQDVNWIKPQKFVGVWWEMHVNKSSWDYSGGQVGSQGKAHVPHGANTANVKRYIDFAAKSGIPSVLVEGWNTGWEDWFGQWKEDVFDFVTPYPDFDVNQLHQYAAAKGVKLIMHHETSGSATNYERWMDTAYRFMKNNGYDAVKTGYVGRIIPRGEHHDGQWMVRHYERVAAKTAGYQIMVDMHEPVRPTGMQRTYPNWLACEAARGNEFNAWSYGNPPDHETILPFTRLMGGPMDYTPGIFKIKMSYYDTAKKEQVHTTLTKQLALYLTMYSPLQMAADLPENYDAKPDAFEFIKEVPVDWDDSKYLAAEPGDYIMVARKEKGKDNWFLGAITDENARTLQASLNFLDAGKWYIVTLYRDGDKADWKTNPEEYVIEKFAVKSATTLNLKLAPGGGCAASIKPVTEAEIKGIKKYK